MNDNDLMDLIELEAENSRLRAINTKAMNVCRAVVAEYEDTFISPDEMTGESHEIYAMAKAAVAEVAQPAKDTQ
jgi:hypothetical protein